MDDITINIDISGLDQICNRKQEIETEIESEPIESKDYIRMHHIDKIWSTPLLLR